RTSSKGGEATARRPLIGWRYCRERGSCCGIATGRDAPDTFVLSGAEDLVPVGAALAGSARARRASSRRSSASPTSPATTGRSTARTRYVRAYSTPHLPGPDTRWCDRAVTAPHGELYALAGTTAP